MIYTPKSIFISYRRKDSETIVGRITEKLEGKYGRKAVYRDVDSIPAGAKFPEHLEAALAQCEICLVMIGARWLPEMTARAGGMDYHRREIEVALGRGAVVIPVLIAGAEMPEASALPPSIRGLVEYNARQIRNDPDFKVDIERLCAGIDHTFQKRKNLTYLGAAAAVLLLAAAGALFWRQAAQPNADSQVLLPTEVAKRLGDGKPADTGKGKQPDTASGRSAPQQRTEQPREPKELSITPPSPPVENRPPDRESALRDAAAGNCATLERFVDTSQDGPLFLALGTCLGRANNASEARKMLDRALSLNASEALVRTELARIAQARGEFDESLRQISKVLRVSPGHTDAMVVKGDILLAQHQYGEAATLFNSVFSRTRSKAACEKLAEAYRKNGAEDLGNATLSSCSAP